MLFCNSVQSNKEVSLEEMCCLYKLLATSKATQPNTKSLEAVSEDYIKRFCATHKINMFKLASARWGQ